MRSRAAKKLRKAGRGEPLKTQLSDEPGPNDPAYDLSNPERRFVYQWNKELDSPEFIYGDLSDPATELEPINAALVFLEEHKEMYHLENPVIELDIKGARFMRHSDGKLSIRLQQIHKGVPVTGYRIIIHQRPDRSIYWVDSRIQPGLDIDSGQANITIAEARELALRLSGAPERSVKGGPEKRIIIVDGKPIITWKVAINGTSKGYKGRTEPARWIYYLNYFTGELVTKYNQVAASDLVGKVIPEKSSKVEIESLGKPLVLNCVSFRDERNEEKFRMQDISIDHNVSFRTHVCSLSEEEYQKKMTEYVSQGGEDLYPCFSRSISINSGDDLEDVNNLPIVQCHAMSHTVLNFFADLGLAGATKEGDWGRLNAISSISFHRHLGSPFSLDNEVFIPSGIELKDGTLLYGPFSMFEVVAHEWAHVIIRNDGAAYSPFGWPGALEEALCDAFACIIKKGVFGSKTWHLLAEDNFWQKDDKIRAGKNMMDPLQGLDPAALTPQNAMQLCIHGHQAAHMGHSIPPLGDGHDDEENDYGWIHVNSGIMNRATYLMLNGSTDPSDPFMAIDPNVLAKTYFHIVTKHPAFKESFSSFGLKLLTEISELYGDDIENMLISGEKKDAMKAIANWKFTIMRAFDLVGVKIDCRKSDLSIPLKFPGLPSSSVEWRPKIRKSDASKDLRRYVGKKK